MEFINKAPLVVHDTPRLPLHERTLAFAQRMSRLFGPADTEFSERAPLAVHDTPRLPLHERTVMHGRVP